MTIEYTPRPGSYPAKAIEVLLPLAGKMLASGALAQLIGANVKHMGTVLRVAIEHRAIAVQRTQSGNWYGIGDLYAGRPASPAACAEAESLVRQLPTSSVFDLGAPTRVLPIPGRQPRIKTIDAGLARFSVWSDGGIRIDRGEQSVSLTPAESRELAALVKGKTFEDIAA
jgi:hypothetical protein